ncbi:MAG: hypothetical protein H3C39_06950 [Flavobacteriia bacterium]|nr:hypothetical protein [Flavobacteriia bacterium]
MNKYRLRLNRRIIGYAEETEDGLLFRGREGLWWMRGKPNYDKVDLYVGFQDKFHRDVYENDLVNYRLNAEAQMRKGVISKNPESGIFGILDLKSKHFTQLFVNGLCLFQSEKMEIYSHLFNHPELEDIIHKH